MLQLMLEKAEVCILHGCLLMCKFYEIWSPRLNCSYLTVFGLGA